MLLLTIKNIGFLLFETLKYLKKRPKMLVMLVVALLLYVPIYYYLVLMEPVLDLDWTPFFIRLAVFFVGVPFVFTFVNFVFIEMAKQEHKKKDIQFFGALLRGFLGFIRALPLVIIWVLLRYPLLVLKPIFAPPRLGDNEFSSINREIRTSRSGRRSIDVYAVAKWNTGKNFMSNLFRRGLHDGFMMMYTGLSVEEGYFRALKKALNYYKKEVGMIRTGYDAASFHLLVLVLPAMLTIGFIPYELTMKILFAYLGLMWIYLVIVKQLFLTNLYLWMDDFDVSDKTSIFKVDKPVYLYCVSASYFRKFDKS